MKAQDDKAGRQGTGSQQQKQGTGKQGKSTPHEEARRNLSDQSGSAGSRSSTSRGR